MKIRNDFVSNSSSSSFIVISDSGKDLTEDIKSRHSNTWMYIAPTEDAKHTFGWEYENTRSFEGKLNFVALQLLYLLRLKVNQVVYPEGSYEQCKYKDRFDELFDMTRKVCKEKFGINFGLNSRLLQISFFDYKSEYHMMAELDDYYYIDHQSAADINSCMEMFESEETLYNFLKTEDSYVQGGNDNYDYDD